jgi:hypothetical protein
MEETLFSVTNAANSHNKNTTGVTGDIEKFRMMFSPSLQIVTSYNARTLSRGNLKSKYPTDEQAEVLVKDEISISDVFSICFVNEFELATAKAALANFDTSKFAVDSSLFNRARI